jgi:hypothetical protein
MKHHAVDSFSLFSYATSKSGRAIMAAKGMIPPPSPLPMVKMSETTSKFSHAYFAIT